MKKNQQILFCLLLIILLVPKSSLAQEKVEIHPLIGDTITYDEAYKYYLFRDLGRLDFDYAFISLVSGTHSVQFFGDSIYSYAIDSVQVKQYIGNIDLINQYELASTQKDTNKVFSDGLMLKSVDLHIMNDEQKKKMIKNAHRYNMKKLEADEQGLHGNQRADYMNYSGGYYWETRKKKK